MPKFSSRLRQRRKRREQLENVYKGMMGISSSIEMLLPILHDIGDSVVAMIMAPFVTADLLYLCGRILKLGTYMALVGRWSEEEIEWIGATIVTNNVSAFQKLVDCMVQVLSALTVQRYYFKGRAYPNFIRKSLPLSSAGVKLLGSSLVRLNPVREQVIRQAQTEFEAAHDYTYLSYAAPG